MEALLLTVEFGLMTWLVFTIMRRDRGEKSGRHLGFFRYKDEARRRATAADPAAKPVGKHHA